MPARLRSRSSVVRLASVTCSLALLVGCQGEPSASELAIRAGRPVVQGAAGPDRVSTVGLKIIQPRGIFTCSAAVLSRDLLVTAAHCLDQGASEVVAYFGTDMTQAAEPDEVRYVSKAVLHPSYGEVEAEGGLPTHDVAVLQLSAPIPDTHAPIPVLPDPSWLVADTPVLVAGFGITETGGDGDVLRSVVTTYAGSDRYGRLLIADPLKRGACSGDSGGPLYVQVEDAWYLAGVLSGGPIPCRGINVYTPVSPVDGFIPRGGGGQPGVADPA